MFACRSPERALNEIANPELFVYSRIHLQLISTGEDNGYSMINKAILVGRLGKDPEVRYTPDGAMVTSFSLATDEQWKDKSGEKVQKTEWHNIVTFGKLAEICGNYLAKGLLVYIEGRIRTRSWEGKDGVERYTTEIIAADMKMLSPKGADRGEARNSSEGHFSPYNDASPLPEDDVPF
jgi:single-strand DNA-binding protein